MSNNWLRFREQLWSDRELGVLLDISRMDMTANDLTALADPMNKAFAAMSALEAGGIANQDENRQVGHFWLRAPELAPTTEQQAAITETRDAVNVFAKRVRAGDLLSAGGAPFTEFLLVGIGGSALGPQFVADALGDTGNGLNPHFIDNTDPDGIDRGLAALGDRLKTTLTVVVSKSGGTKETRNGMLEARAAYEAMGLTFGPHAVAVTGLGSKLDAYAKEEGFLAVFPMWDWVGGRTSVFSAVGLLPAALQGIDMQNFLNGAARMDERTRIPELQNNPAALLAAAWHHAGHGKGEKAMVVLPYRDRLLLFSRYLQQLIMESLGKEKDRAGNVVHQGLAVYGNKGSTDQHAYVQQLRDGRNDFFATFIEVQLDRETASIAFEDGATAGDFLLGFLLGTRSALHAEGRQSLTLTLPDVNAATVGMLIALYERAVGLYAELINVNAYHQPGVEAGKKAAGRVLELQRAVLELLRRKPGRVWGLEELSRELADANADPETLLKVLDHAAANPDHRVVRTAGVQPWESTYSASYPIP